MPEPQDAPPPLPPEVLAYLRGPTDESLQFGFLIGAWRVEGRRHGPQGDQAYTATWNAQYVHGRRMVVDHFTVTAPSGQEVSAFTTLRTYSPAAQRWELAGMGAHQPAIGGPWFGRRVGDEMHLEAEGRAPNGHTVHSRIRFFDIEPSRFLWENHVSLDGGASWVKAASLVAHRAD